jgi:hypothetical protein
VAKRRKSGAKSSGGKKGLSQQSRRLAASGKRQSKRVSEAQRRDRGGPKTTPTRQDVKRVVPRMQRQTRP